jgi:hypothetical protein
MLDTLAARTPDLSVVDQVADAFTAAEAAEQLQVATNNVELLLESLADVELALEDRGWDLVTRRAEIEFTRTGLKRAARLARTMAIVNPLIRRGLNLRAAYVWSGGVEIRARATGQNDDNTGEQDVNSLIQAFLDDKATRKVLTSAAARESNERTLGTDGIFAVACFTKPLTGRVQIREIPSDELEDRVTNPEDETETWYWKRVWVERYLGPDGARSSESRTTYYPDIDYRPAPGARLDRIGGNPIMWDAPLAVLTVNGLSTWDFGIGDAFAALPWARAYKEFLEDWARLVKSLSRFAWRQTAGTKGKAQTAAAAVKAAVQPADVSAAVGPSPVGAVAVGGPGMGSLEAIPKSGATIDSDSGKPLAGMVAAGLDVPVTMLLADPGTTGARAVAETLDRPTEDMATMRRDVWGDFHRQLLDYVIDQAVKAPRGPLKGTVTRDEWGREVVTLAGETARTIEIEWPDLSETPMKDLIEAITAADGVQKLPPLTIAKLLLQALGVKDADEILDTLVDDQGNWVDPYADAEATAAQAAVDKLRRGGDPASQL